MSIPLPVEGEDYRLENIGGEVAGLGLQTQPDTALNSADILELRQPTRLGALALYSESRRRLKEIQADPASAEHFHKQYRLFQQAFREADGIDEPRTINGPLHENFNALLGRCSQLLEAIYPGLPESALVPSPYQPPEVRAQMRILGQTSLKTYETVSSLRRAKMNAIDDLVDDNMPGLLRQSIPPGRLDTPVYAKQIDSQVCVGTSFLMVLESLAGKPINHEAFFSALLEKHRQTIVEDSAYLKLLSSPAINKFSRRDIRSFSFAGADLAMIGDLAGKVKDRLPDCQVFCVVSLLSDSGRSTSSAGIWHSNVLLSADDTYVEVHDPANTSGGPNKRLLKDAFLRRWGQAYNRGHLLIAAAAPAGDD